VVLSARPGRVAQEYRVPFARPRSLEIMAMKEVFDLTNTIKMDIVGERVRPKARERGTAEIVRIRP
ncbi:MAG: ABC transporter ATP-binding protein, partial [Mesorhizobium sp.]